MLFDFFSFLALKTIPLIVFFSTWKFIYDGYTIRIKRGLQINFTLYMVWNLHSSIQAWCDKYSLEDWSHQQNALGDNKTLGERIVRTWGDGSIIPWNTLSGNPFPRLSPMRSSPLYLNTLYMLDASTLHILLESLVFYFTK